MSADAAQLDLEDEGQVQLAGVILKLRGLGISDRSVLNAFESVPRALFVPREFARHLYSDHALPIQCGQITPALFVVAAMTAALDVCDRHAVLEIGTGCGYQTAILSRLARRVTTIERFRTLSKAAEARFEELGLRNVTALVGDGLNGWKRQAPFDRILVTAACAEPPVKLITQLSANGILIAPLDFPQEHRQRLTLFQRIGQDVDTRDLGPAHFLPIVPGPAKTL